MQFVKKYKAQLLFSALLLLTMLFRIVNIGSWPDGLNQDEASIGYDAWSILNYGIDRNGNSYPVHLVAWGSGQNALYAYIIMPFIAVFGLNEFSIRLPMAIFSILSVVAVYFIMKQFFGRKVAFIAMALYSFNPWTIMSARWCIESSLYPMLFILALWALVASLKHKGFIYLAAVLFSVSLYSYGPAYLVTTLFCFITFIYFIVKKLIPLRYLVSASILFLVLSAPIYLFVLINAFDLQQIKLFNLITIPKEYNRMGHILQGQSISTIIENIFSVFVFQYDVQNRCSLQNPLFGCIYCISLPFWIYGLYISFKKKGHFTNLLIILSIVSFALLFIFSWVNTNRVGIIYVPMVLFASIGIYEFTQKRKKFFYIVFTVYSLLFAGFCFIYFTPSYQESDNVINQFVPTYREALAKAEELDNNNEKTIYIDAPLNMPYVYNLFYNRTNPHDFINNVVWYNKNDEFDAVYSCENYVYSDDYIRRQEINHKNTEITPYSGDFTLSGIHILLKNSSQMEKLNKTTKKENINAIYEFKNFLVADIK